MPKDSVTRRQRFRLVAELERLLDAPATYLAFVFAGALVLELVITAQGGEIPATLNVLQLAIWGLFALHFALGLAIAPDRLMYVRRHWLTALSLAVPFLRVIRIVRVVGLLRAATVVRLLAGLNRTATGLRRSLAWNGAGYATGLSLAVILLSSAGIYLFESESAASPIGSYSQALWWSASTLTTVGASFEPVTLGGRLIALFVMLAGLVLLGYIAGLLGAILFRRRAIREGARDHIGRPAEQREGRSA